jgi:uncharacterized membrane protein
MPSRALESTSRAHPLAGLTRALWRLVRHRWHEPQARRALTEAALQRLTSCIAASEQQHTGQIRIVVEAALPWSYLRRHATARERAVMLFSKYRVWDTQHNNGVLIYLLVPEHAIEIVADRGLASHIDPQEWRDLLLRMAACFKESRFEEGLEQAIASVSQRLAQSFPRAEGEPGLNELPDTPVVQ